MAVRSSKPPLSKGGGPPQAVEGFFHYPVDIRAYFAEILIDCIVGNTKDGKSSLLQPLCAEPVRFQTRFFIVLRPVQFND